MASPIPIVADASPLISAARAGELALVKKVYLSLILPTVVYDEITAHGSWRAGAEEIRKAKDTWIQVREASDHHEIERLMQRLGRGESEAIVLAGELHTVLYADEGAVIAEARRRDITITSTITMLMEAKNMKLISSVKEMLDKFIEADLRISEELYQSALKQAGE